jgi:hypothetical protein
MSKKEREIERRKSPRVPVKARIELWRNERVEKREKGWITNINLEGMCIETPLGSSVGTDLVFRLDMRQKIKVNIYGKIIWQKEKDKRFIYGIKFTELDIDKKPKLYRFVLVTLFLSEQK